MTNEEDVLKLLIGLNMISNHLTYIERVALARLNGALIHKDEIVVPFGHLKDMINDVEKLFDVIPEYLGGELNERNSSNKTRR